jgi:acyl-CoA synthetase (AMP-forming)/AMP-acid ligase II
MVLGEIYERNAALYPNGQAIWFEGESVSHAELLARGQRLANALAARGVRRQRRVAIFAQNSTAYLEFYAACELAGYIGVPVNYRLSAPEAGYILRDAAPLVLIFELEYAELIASLRSSLPAGLRYICIGGQLDWAEDYQSVRESGSATPPPTRARSEDIAYIIYTSGTTGRPKGAMLGHAGQMALAQSLAEEGGIQADERMLIVMPYYHIGAKCSTMAASWRGGGIILHRKYDPAALARAIDEHLATSMHVAPIMMKGIMDLPDFESYDHGTLRTVYYGSAPMPVAQLRRAVAAYGRIFIQPYGMTETGGGTILQKHQHRPEGSQQDIRRLYSAGQSPPGHAIRVIDDQGRDCPTGISGEVLIRAPSMMLGYWNNMPATIEALEDGWMHTGDIGYLDEERFLFIVDRKKDMIVSGGENIYPREVEEVLHAHPAVAEAAVIGVPDDQWGESVKAFIVLAVGQGATEADIIEHCRANLASYKKPKSVDFVASLPRLANLKINKVALRAPFWTGRDRQVN